MEPNELKSLVEETKRAWQSLGEISYGPTEAEVDSLIFRRSIYAACDIEKGDIFNPSNIRIIRPGYGAPPYLYKDLLGCRARQNYKRGMPIALNQILS